VRCVAIKIVTVNVPESYIDAIKKLVGEDGLFPSRSELIRIAVREFLLNELKHAENTAKLDKQKEGQPKLDPRKFARVPIEKDGKREFKTYKVIKRMEI